MIETIAAGGSKGWEGDKDRNPVASHLKFRFKFKFKSKQFTKASHPEHQPCNPRFTRIEGTQLQLGPRLDHIMLCYIMLYIREDPV